MNRPDSKAVGSRRAFTLLELLIVLFLSTLILGLTTMVFSRALSAGRLQATARELSATIRQARALARIQDNRQVITFDLDAQEYSLNDSRTRKIPAPVQLRLRDPYQGDIRQGRVQLIVDPNRGLEGPLLILAGKKRQIQIEIDPIVGSTVVR